MLIITVSRRYRSGSIIFQDVRKKVVRGVNWLKCLGAVEELEDAPFDMELVRRMEEQGEATLERPIRFSTPTFKSYESTELKSCSQASFPAFSVTGGACALDCEHCHANILKPMIPAMSPEELDVKVRRLIVTRRLHGFLLSGGSNRKNEIKYERFYPVLEGLKRDYPEIRIAIHSALLDEGRAQTMASAGIDTAMLDIIGHEDTIREIYHLDRTVDDFEESLSALCSTQLEVVPHIVIGLHYGQVLGELNALEIISRHNVYALVLVVIMPFYGTPEKFSTPTPEAIGEIFLRARKQLPTKDVLLGCARPAGLHKRVTDSYAVMAGLDGIAFPAEGTVTLARAIGRKFDHENMCCSLKIGQNNMLSPASHAL